MSAEKAGLLTTGQAAKLCAVTPDTVLKWIKKGRLEATRTAGGHYRVALPDLEPFMAGFGQKARCRAHRRYRFLNSVPGRDKRGSGGGPLLGVSFRQWGDPGGLSSMRGLPGEGHPLLPHGRTGFGRRPRPPVLRGHLRRVCLLPPGSGT